MCNIHGLSFYLAPFCLTKKLLMLFGFCELNIHTYIHTYNGSWVAALAGCSIIFQLLIDVHKCVPFE